MALLNIAELSAKLEQGEPIDLSFSYPTDSIIKSFNAIFAKVLGRYDIMFLLDTVTTIIREILVNAVKANAKRIYFEKLNLDINDHHDYEEGMKNFKKNVVGNLETIENDLNQSRYRINTVIRAGKDGIEITVINNASILPEELARIYLRMEKAQEYNDFADAYEHIYDDTEGAGLGIVLTTLLLKNSGIDAKSYGIDSDGKVTRSSFTIPFQLKPVPITTEIKTQIIREVKGLPTFPKNILELQTLCRDPESSMGKITGKIMVDPALSADVLKLSNSAGFITGKRVENLNEAVIIIGLKNLSAILTATASRRILDQRYSRFEQIWNHCNRGAFYARQLALRARMGKFVEHSFLAGLLHDFGKIVLLSINAKVTNWIADIVKNRKIRTSTVMEEVSIGISHSAIGEMIARKWNFPDYLVEAIQYHHSPLIASQENRDLVFATYLANMLCGIETKRYHFYFIEDQVLERFGLQKEEDFVRFHDNLKKLYQEETS